MRDAIQRFIQAWNYHRIPGPDGGIPNLLAEENSRIVHLTPSLVPSTVRLTQIHEQDGHPLCRDASYGHDPLNGHPRLQVLHELCTLSGYECCFSRRTS